MKKTFKIFCFILFNNILFSQNIKDDFVRTTKAYANTKSYSIEMEIEGYGINGDLSYNISGVYIQKGLFLYQKINNNIVLINKDIALLVIGDEKQIIYSTNKESNLSQRKTIDLNGYIEGLDDIINLYDSIDFVENNLHKKYTISLSKGIVEKVYVHFEKTTNLVSYIKYVYKDKNMYSLSSLVLKFKNIIDSNIKDSMFSEKQFIEKVKGEYIGQGKYRNYKIINNKMD